MGLGIVEVGGEIILARLLRFRLVLFEMLDQDSEYEKSKRSSTFISSKLVLAVIRCEREVSPESPRKGFALNVGSSSFI